MSKLETSVVIVIPTLNEADYICDVIRTLSSHSKDGVSDHYPIWVVDGGSVDATVGKVERLNFKHVSIMHNPAKTQAQAVNLAARLALDTRQIETLFLIDAHARYPANFVPTILATMKITGAASVVVPMQTIGGSKIQDAGAILFGAWLGNGGAPHRTAKFRGYVKHGHHAAIKLAAFAQVGGYDIAYQGNQDAELDIRLANAGYRIFLENKVCMQYIPRRTLAATAKQFGRNGRGRIRTAIKHQQRLALRQILPAVLAPILLSATALALLIQQFFWIVPGGYLAAVIALSFLAARKSGAVRLTLLVSVLALVAHLSFSIQASGQWLALRLVPSKVHWLRNDGARLTARQERRGRDGGA